MIHDSTSPDGTEEKRHLVVFSRFLNAEQSLGQWALVADPTITSLSGSHSL
jgi:hypothetical protein